MCTSRFLRVTGVVSLAASLLSCAQGGPGTALAAHAAPAAAAVAMAAPDPAAGRCGIARFEAVATLKINAYRNAGARCGRAGSFASAAPLAWSEPLARAALRHSQDMARHGHFGHRGRDGSEPSQRVDAAGYDWKSTSENIAFGQGSVEEVLAGWIASPGHCANMMAPEMREFGLACVAREGGEPYWTLVLGRSR